jgi:uncharacterized membrane protein
MLRSLLRLIPSAVLTAILFAVFTLALGYLSIDVMKLHAPLPAENEIAVLATGLLSTTPLIFALALLGMLFAWSDARRLSIRRLLILAAACSIILSVIFTLEDIPRHQAVWIGLMLPVVVVAVCYWGTRLLGRQGVEVKSKVDH